MKKKEKMVKMLCGFIENLDMDLYGKLPADLRERLNDDFQEYMTTQRALMDHYKGKYYIKMCWETLPDNQWTIFRKKQVAMTAKTMGKPPVEVLIQFLEILENPIEETEN